MITSTSLIFYAVTLSAKTLTFDGYYVGTQLFEALFLFALFAVLTIMYFKKSKRLCMPVYLVGYGIWRLIIEFFRTDYRGAAVLGLYPSQWQSLFFIAAGVAIILFYIIRKIPLVEMDKKAAKMDEKQDETD